MDPGADCKSVAREFDSFLVHVRLDLECQECGDLVFFDLSEEQKRLIAEKPYDYIVYCKSCKNDIEKDMQ